LTTNRTPKRSSARPDARRQSAVPPFVGELPADFASHLVEWQRCHGRHSLPWQVDRDPYRVWLSEVMLQQTQVGTVLAYYTRFVDRFPDVLSLAAASLDEVLASWSGLGYYGRARNLHLCAKAVVAEHGGAFPRHSAELARLPGIGRSTAAAIAAFCFGERVAILDGNVKRVLTRVLAFDADLSGAVAERTLWEAATRLLPERDIATYTQGLMDLGATVCLTRAPRCGVCPVRGACAAAAAGTPERYPVKSRTLRRGRRASVWLDLRWRQQVFLVQRPAAGVWASLWSLPELDTAVALGAATDGWPGRLDIEPAFTHVLTHLDWLLQPARWTFPDDASAAAVDTLIAAWPQGRWFDLDAARALGLPEPLRKRLTAA